MTSLAVPSGKQDADKPSRQAIQAPGQPTKCRRVSSESEQVLKWVWWYQSSGKLRSGGGSLSR
eukprot:458488-Rhodomonas_salina.10